MDIFEKHILNLGASPQMKRSVLPNIIKKYYRF